MATHTFPVASLVIAVWFYRADRQRDRQTHTDRRGWTLYFRDFCQRE